MQLHPANANISQFFSVWSLPQAAGRLNKAIVAASTKKIYDGRSPAELVYFFEKMTELLEWTQILVQDEELLQEAILKDSDKGRILGLTEHSLYCGWAADTDPWDYFPRHLSTKEFFNPYKALKKIVYYQSTEKWEQTLKDLLQYALSDTAFSEFEPEFPMFRVSNMLFKLMEACHLIDVRAINEDENGPRPKWKKRDNTKKSPKEDGTDEPEGAYAGIKEFFDFFGEEGGAEELWEMLKRALSNEGDETPAKDRGNMIFVYEEIKKMIENVFIIHERREGDLKI